MKDILINVLIEHMPELVELLFAVLSAVITVKIIPLIKGKITKTQLDEIKDWTKFLVESAQRLDKSGKLENITKKEYVMDKLMEHVKELEYNFTEEQLDDIRRSAVLALENAEKIADSMVESVVSSEDGVE